MHVAVTQQRTIIRKHLADQPVTVGTFTLQHLTALRCRLAGNG